MTKPKKVILLTNRKRLVVKMIKRLTEPLKPGDELGVGQTEPLKLGGEFRVRKLQRKLMDYAKELGQKLSKCLIGDTIKMLLDEGILSEVERGVTLKDELNGDNITSILYEWHQDVYESCELKVVGHRPPSKPRVKKGVSVQEPAPSVVVEEVTPENWYSALKKEIREKEAQYAILGNAISELKKLAAEVDESIENVRRCFAHREGK